MIRTIALFAAFLLAMAGGAQAQWPDKPVKILVGYPAGGANDQVARIVAARLSDALKQNFIVENRTGAAGSIAAEVAAKATPDGYTLYMISSAQLITPAVRKVVSFDPVKDFRAIALCAIGPYFLVVHKDVPAKNLAEFVALAKAKPNAINYASSGVGAGPHLTSSLLWTMAGIELNHVPFRGDADAMVDLIAGRVQAGFISTNSTNPHIISGALRALAVSGTERSSLQPNVPTVAESGYPGFDMGAWWGLVGQAKVPDDVIRRAVAAMQTILSSPEFATAIAPQGITPGKQVGEAFAKRIVADTTKFADVVKRAGIQPE
jgi:tripartite-type tricarboxylate transporter receptor subunit TctC